MTLITKTRIRLFSFYFLFVLTFLFASLKSQTAFAEPLTVTKQQDTNDGRCDADCSLREAVIEANQHPGTVINLPPGTYTLTIAGSGENAAATGDLDITTNMTISGSRGAAQTIIDGGGSALRDFIFHVIGPAGMPATLTLSGVTLRHSQMAAILVTSTGNLDLSNSIVADNVGNYSSSLSILSGGTATLSNVSVSNNTLTGGISNAGTLTLSNSTLSGNSGNRGGGLFNTGTATLTNVTISGNQATYNGGIYNSGTLTLLNNTISSNISNDETPSGGGGGIYTARGATTSMKNTIVSGNVDMSNQGPDCLGTFVSQGHNLVQDAHCAGLISSDLVASNPQLAPLASNGGPTFTQALPLASPAVRGGDAVGCPTTDQREMSRVGGCDIGAYQFQAICGDGTRTLPEECDGGPRCNTSCRLIVETTTGTGGTNVPPSGSGGRTSTATSSTSAGGSGVETTTGTGGTNVPPSSSGGRTDTATSSTSAGGSGGSATTSQEIIADTATHPSTGTSEATTPSTPASEASSTSSSGTSASEAAPSSGGGCSLIRY